MAVTFNWSQGASAALAEAIEAMDVRLAAVELLTGTGRVVAPAAVAATASVPTHWVQNAIYPPAITATATVPTVTVRGAAAYTTTTVAGVAAVPTPTVTVP